MGRPDLDIVLEAIRRNDRDGATTLARRAAEAVAAWAESEPRIVAPEATELVRTLMELRPSLAPLLRLAEAIAPALRSTEAERPRALGAAAGRFAADLAASPGRIAARLASAPPDDPRIATYSAGALVREALLALHRAGTPLRVVLSEARPACEGRALAEELAGAGIPVRLLTDAALAGALCDVASLWLGADALTPDGLVHKVGTAPLAAAARRAGLEVRVLAGEAKILGPALAAALRLESGAPAAVYDGRTQGVEAENPLFDVTPWEWIDTIVLESGLHPAPEVRRRIGATPSLSEIVHLLRPGGAPRGEI